MVKFSDGRVIYLTDYEQWLNLKLEIEDLPLDIDEIGLRYRTHLITVDTSQAEGVYLVRSIMAQFGGESIHFYTTGVLCGTEVLKTRWHVPALVKETTELSDLEDCFEEALILNGRQA